MPQSLALVLVHIIFSTKNRMAFLRGLVLHPPLLPNPRRSNTPDMWLRLCRAASFCSKNLCAVSFRPGGEPESTLQIVLANKEARFRRFAG
jgi:hypothetical protein